MKKQNIFIMGLSVILMFSTLRPAQAIEEVEIKTIEATKMIRMEVANPASSEINVVLYDRAERIVYNDRIPAGATFEDQFDFSKVRQGKYRLVTQLENTRLVRVFDVKDNGIALAESYYSFTPQFVQEEELLSVNFLNSPKEQVRVEISDSWETIFEDYNKDPGMVFTKNYDLRELPRGFYTFRLISDREAFSYDFVIE